MDEPDPLTPSCAEPGSAWFGCWFVTFFSVGPRAGYPGRYTLRETDGSGFSSVGLFVSFDFLSFLATDRLSPFITAIDKPAMTTMTDIAPAIQAPCGTPLDLRLGDRRDPGLDDFTPTDTAAGDSPKAGDASAGTGGGLPPEVDGGTGGGGRLRVGLPATGTTMLASQLLHLTFLPASDSIRLCAVPHSLQFILIDMGKPSGSKFVATAGVWQETTDFRGSTSPAAKCSYFP